MAKRPPTVADLLANRGRHQYAMLRVETIDEAEAASLAGVEMFSIPPAMMNRTPAERKAGNVSTATRIAR